MSTRNTARSFGTVTRTFHWLTALLILTAIPLGLIANRLPYDTAEALAFKAQLFSIHKSIGIAAFAIALARILWALREQHPVPLHPERRAETLLAGVIHWVLYISLVAVPLSGWVHHAATTGFAPILWPAALGLGQGLPFVPKSEAVAQIAASAHWVFTKLLAASILLHIAGALKHHLIDRDSTLRRMTRGVAAPMHPETSPRTPLPIALAFGLYALGAAVAWSIVPQTAAAVPTATTAVTKAATTGNWQVDQGVLGLSVKQMGQEITGSFATWSADITFDETATDGSHGTVTVTVDTGSLTLGSVSAQATGKDFLDSAAFPKAVFTADITSAGDAYAATGTLTLKDAKVPLTLPFTLAITGNTATMQGTATLDRRSVAIGANYPDEASVGYAVNLSITLTASRTD